MQTFDFTFSAGLDMPVEELQNPIMKKENYIAPEVEVIEVEIEKGFAASGGGGDFGVPNGGDNWGTPDWL